MEYRIALLAGDGIGPEITAGAAAVLEETGKLFGHSFHFTPYLIGGAAIDAVGEPLPQETLDGCLASDSVLLGAVGGPKWDGLSGDKRPEKALLGIRKALGLYANLRPVRIFPVLKGVSPLRADIIGDGLDILIVRELTGGIYFGERGRQTTETGEEAFDTERYSVPEIERICRTAFEAARKRNRRVTSIDKANVLETSRLWRSVFHRTAAEYPDIEISDLFVDNAAMQLVRDPKQFDVIVTTNMFGDILSDEASQISGSIGLLASASLGSGTRGLYEPIHGSAPDIAGKDTANPIAMILSCAMMLQHSFGLSREAAAIEAAVFETLEAGFRTADLCGSDSAKAVGCRAMTKEICARLRT